MTRSFKIPTVSKIPIDNDLNSLWLNILGAFLQGDIHMCRTIMSNNMWFQAAIYSLFLKIYLPFVTKCSCVYLFLPL